MLLAIQLANDKFVKLFNQLLPNFPGLLFPITAFIEQVLSAKVLIFDQNLIVQLDCWRIFIVFHLSHLSWTFHRHVNDFRWNEADDDDKDCDQKCDQSPLLLHFHFSLLGFCLLTGWAANSLVSRRRVHRDIAVLPANHLLTRSWWTFGYRRLWALCRTLKAV